MSGWRDLNPRPPAPHAGAIPGYATSRILECKSTHFTLKIVIYRFIQKIGEKSRGNFQIEKCFLNFASVYFCPITRFPLFFRWPINF